MVLWNRFEYTLDVCYADIYVGVNVGLVDIGVDVADLDMFV